MLSYSAYPEISSNERQLFYVPSSFGLHSSEIASSHSLSASNKTAFDLEASLVLTNTNSTLTEGGVFVSAGGAITAPFAMSSEDAREDVLFAVFDGLALAARLMITKGVRKGEYRSFSYRRSPRVIKEYHVFDGSYHFNCSNLNSMTILNCESASGFKTKNTRIYFRAQCVTSGFEGVNKRRSSNRS